MSVAILSQKPRLVGGLLIAPVVAYSAPVDWIGVTGDWFDGTQWNTGNAPTAVDQVTVTNGGTALTTSSW